MDKRKWNKNSRIIIGQSSHEPEESHGSRCRRLFCCDSRLSGNFQFRFCLLALGGFQYRFLVGFRARIGDRDRLLLDLGAYYGRSANFGVCLAQSSSLLRSDKRSSSFKQTLSTNSRGRAA